MTVPTTSPAAKFSNHILSSLPEGELHRVTKRLKPFELRFGEIIYEAGDAIDTVYFPEKGLVSLLATLDGESVLEVGVVSTEGLVGLSAFLGSTTSRTRALVQGEGTALVMSTPDLLKECERSKHLSQALRSYAQSLLAQVSQSAICNRFHKIEHRLARWLLTSSDCIGSDEFRLTQEFLSHMLGVRREAVNSAARRMQDDGIINYSRGRITIFDRPRLEAAACECYSIIKEDLSH